MPTPSIDRMMNVAVAGLLISLLAGCGGGTDEEASVEEDGTPATEVGSGGEASCVADYAERPCDLLTEDLVRARFPDAPAEIEQDSHSGSMYSSCSYSWPSDRMATQEVAGRTMEYPESNTVGLSWIETYESDDPRAQFRREYLPTGEEMQRGREQMERELDERTAEGEMTEEQRDVAGEVAESVGGDLSFEPVDEAGDMASWSGTTLYVLDGATNFQVEANVSAESSVDREAAVAVANELMAACQ